MALTRPFAQNGDKLAIPDTASDSSVSYNLGFTYAYALPPEEGGKFIDRAQFNQLMYDTTSQVIENKTAIATKANATAVVNLNGNQTINNIKTFSVPPVSATNPTQNNQVANKAYVDSVGNTAVKLTGNQTIQGTKTFNNNIVSPNITAMQNNLNTIFSSTTSPVKTQTETKVITVGTGGNFATIPQAIAEAIKYTSLVAIKLISNITTTGNINIANVDGHHITINFNNFKIINSNTSTASLFEVDNSNIAIIDNLNLDGYEFRASSTSSIMLKNNVTVTAGNRTGMRAISVNNGSTVATYSNIVYTTQSSNDLSPFFCEDGSILAFGNLNSIVDTSSAEALFVAATGGIISTINLTSIQTTCTATANIAANTPTANGIIFGNYSL